MKPGSMVECAIGPTPSLVRVVVAPLSIVSRKFRGPSYQRRGRQTTFMELQLGQGCLSFVTMSLSATSCVQASIVPSAAVASPDKIRGHAGVRGEGRGRYGRG